MEIYIIIGVGILLSLLTIFATKNAANKRKVFKNNTYEYAAKSLPMTKTESEFFMTLESAVSERYYVFPQLHLSAILEHKIKGQAWNPAFRHINGMSVDFALCDKVTLRPTYAIELDDHTHDMPHRQKRDVEVERIFRAANLPLVRFKNKAVAPTEIIRALTDANG